MPGRVYAGFVKTAMGLTSQPRLPSEQEALCDAVSRARLARRGAGHTGYVPVEPEQAKMLMKWVGAGAPEFLRNYRDAVLAALAALERSSDGDAEGT